MTESNKFSSPGQEGERNQECLSCLSRQRMTWIKVEPTTDGLFEDLRFWLFVRGGMALDCMQEALQGGVFDGVEATSGF